MVNRMRSNPRLAIVLPNMKPGGAERNRLLLANSLVERGVRVDLVLRESVGQLLEELDPRVRIVELKAKKVRNAVLPLCAYFRRERPQAALVAMWPLSVAAVAAKLLAFRSIRLVVSEHTTLSRSPVLGVGLRRLASRLSIGLMYRLADAVVAVSHGVARDLIALSLPSIRQPVVVYNEARFAGGVYPASPGEPKKEHPRARFICVGSLKPAKDHETLLRAFAIVEREMDAELLLVGDGPERARIESLADELGVRGRISLLGYRSDVGDLVAGSDVLVLSSRWEGFPNVLVEALSLGVQVVSTDCHSGPSEILDGGRYGRLVPVGDDSALAHAMLQSIAAPFDRKELIRSVERFSREAFINGYLGVLAMPATGGK